MIIHCLEHDNRVIARFSIRPNMHVEVQKPRISPCLDNGLDVNFGPDMTIQVIILAKRLL